MLDSFRLSSAADQVACYLRDAVRRRLLSDEMPGIHQLAADLQVNHKTVSAALHLLEDDGTLVSQGQGRRRKIPRPDRGASASLRVGIFCLDAADPGLDYLIEIQHLLGKAGHVPFYPSKTLVDLGMDVKRIARFVKGIEVDAWIVIAASRQVLEWFARQAVPAFALFGRRQKVGIAGAGPLTIPVIATIVDRLVELGHRRVVLLSRAMRRLPEPAEFERTFLAQLDTHGISVGPYNLPDWEESRVGFQKLLDSLFKITPPTALIVHEAHQFVALLQYFAGRGLRTPEDVSIICLDPDRNFLWCEPPIAHINWDMRKVVSCVMRWSENVARGRDDREQTKLEAEFVGGGTIGPAPRLKER